MKYWKDMTSKYGFDDGATVPEGAEKYRMMYIDAVNTIAEHLGSRVRVEAYDRPGSHNWCLILYTVKNPEGGICDPDEAMRDAIDHAKELQLDTFVTVKVRCAVKDYRDCVNEALLTLKRGVGTEERGMSEC